MQRLPIRSTSSNKLLAHFYISGCVHSTLHEARLSCQQLYAPTLYPVTASASCVTRAVALCLESSDTACQATISDSTRSHGALKPNPGCLMSCRGPYTKRPLQPCSDEPMYPAWQQRHGHPSVFGSLVFPSLLLLNQYASIAFDILLPQDS